MNRPRAVANRPDRAVLYLRQSTHREESISLDLQETAGREYCERQGYEVVRVESDPGISGRTWNRPAVQRVMAAVEAREAEVVVLWKWSRLSRSRLDWAVAVDKVESVGGRIESATEPLDTTTATGRFARGMLAEFAAFESERIGDVWKETQQRRRRNGLTPNGGDRYGYVRDEDTYTPSAETGELLADLYRRHIAGEGFTRLTRVLNEAGHRTSTGALWSHDKLRSILDSGFAAGLIIQGRYPNATYYPGAHPAIISPEEWESYLARRARSPVPPRVADPKYMLTGLAICADCGGPMRATNRNGVRDGMGCGNYMRTKMGRFVTAKRTNVEAEVQRWIFGLADDLDGLARAEASMRERKAVAINDATAIESRIRKLDERIANIIVGWSSKMEFDRGTEMALERLRAERENLADRQRVASTDAREEFDIRTMAIALRDLWDDMNPLELRSLLARMIAGVLVIPPHIRKNGGSAPVRVRVVPRWGAQ